MCAMERKEVSQTPRVLKFPMLFIRSNYDFSMDQSPAILALGFLKLSIYTDLYPNSLELLQIDSTIYIPPFMDSFISLCDQRT